MNQILEADRLLSQWAIWARKDGTIPKKLGYAQPHYYREVPTDYPEEPDHSPCDIDDQTASAVDSAVSRLQVSSIKSYVVIVHVYRDQHGCHKSVLESAVRAFISEYWQDEQLCRKSVAYG